jgi:hypothetical protein
MLGEQASEPGSGTDLGAEARLIHPVECINAAASVNAS